jgi:NADH-quinone oxidoreductase subunit L
MEHPIETVGYLRWIVLLPLLGAALNGIPGALIQKSQGKRAISLIACAPVALSFLLCLRAFGDLLALPADRRVLLDHVWTWIEVGTLRADAAFVVDPLSAVMILVVTGVGGLIHIYSVGYMHDEKSYWRYFALLNLFTFSMLVLVLGDNILLMFVGWEGVGLCSYALIGFWYSSWDNASAGSKAFIVNRIGDFGFVLGTFLLFWSLSDIGHPTLAFREMAEHAHALGDKTFLGVGVATVITLLLFVGATGKSAQIPLHTWLPDAMAGPTPVSALIHAATMVTAGVYMIARLNFLFSEAPMTLHVVAWVGVLTAFFAATIGLAQNDIKKVLAYSTVSQLGYMFVAMGVGAYAAGIFHLMTHAFFKACLFLGSGSVIHAMSGEQDMRKMGGLKEWMPRTYYTFLISTLAIAGIPPLSGFFSKDEILWKAFSSDHGSPALWLVGFLAAGMTAFYMFRQVFMTFHGENRSDPHVRDHLHESPGVMVYPLIVLASLAVVGGFVGVPAVLGGSNHFEHFLAPVFHAGGHEAAHHGHHDATVEYILMAASVAVAVIGILLARAMYLTRSVSPDTFSEAAGGTPYQIVYNKYYVDEFYEAVFVNGTLLLTRLSAGFDRYVIDVIVDGSAAAMRIVSWINGLFDDYIIDGLVNRLADATMGLGDRFRRLQTGSINGYLYAVVGGVVVVMLLRMMWLA